MDAADRVRLGDVEQVVVAVDGAVPRVELGTAVGVLVEPETLDHGAHRAVEDEDPLRRSLAQRTDAHAGTASSRVRRQLGDRMDVEQAADRVDEVGAVHRVEVEVGHTGVGQPEDLLGGNVGGDQLAGVRIVLEPGEAGRQPAGIDVPHLAAKLLVCSKFCTGMIPGTIGTSMPRARTRST